MNKNESSVPVYVDDGYIISLAKAPKIFCSVSLITKIEFFMPSHLLYKDFNAVPSVEIENILFKLEYWWKYGKNKCNSFNWLLLSISLGVSSLGRYFIGLDEVK